MRRHLRVSVWHRIRNVDLVRRECEFVLERQLVECSRLRVVEFIDLVCIGRVVVGDILTALLVPAALVLLKIPVTFRGPEGRFHPLKWCVKKMIIVHLRCQKDCFPW